MRTTAPTRIQGQFCSLRRGRTLAGPRTGRPQGSPLRRKRISGVGSETAGAEAEPHQRQFLQTQGPVAREEFRPITQILRAGNFLPTQRGGPRKWGPGKGDYEHEVLIWSRPRRSFGFFPIVGKVTRRPQAAKLPAKVSRCGPMRASGPTEVRKTKIAANPR